MATNFKTLKEYFYPDNGSKIFIIPSYQRGYKWSVKESKGETSVEYLVSSLIKSYHNNQQFFLQGMTVVEEGNEVTLIDGQQRTTTLYLLLWCLDPKNIIHKDISLNYSIRKQSKEFLEKLKEPEFDYNSFDPDNKIQDIYYFKQAISQINKLIAEITDRTDFLNYLLNKISLLYIVIDRTKAVRTFTMMNGQKAIMHDAHFIIL